MFDRHIHTVELSAVKENSASDPLRRISTGEKPVPSDVTSLQHEKRSGSPVKLMTTLCGWTDGVLEFVFLLQ